HQTLVPSLHAATLNPKIDFTRSPFRVQTQLEPWARPQVPTDSGLREFPRRAGVSSFGAGGSNAHVVLEEYTGADERLSARETTGYGGPLLLVLSARTETQLGERVQALLGHLN